ncbi:hypothetical protein, partial [Enterococcus hirae]|uniref:hypothetical protein n=1 Tax=Enterococcus hirae TaxID=1354 RepID=UPI001962DF17
MTLTVPDAGQVTHLPTNQDYRLVIKGTVHGQLHIDGGHNVVLVGGDVDSASQGGARFENQSGTLHVEGVHFTSTHASEGIDLAEPQSATV